MHLIIQSQNLATDWIDDLTAIAETHPRRSNHLPTFRKCFTSGNRTKSHQIVRYLDIPCSKQHALNSYLATHALNQCLDWAWLPETYTLSQVGLIAFDMDSTLITIECIDEIARYLNIQEQVEALTSAAMRGEIDFTESLHQRVKLLAGTPVEVLETVYADHLRLSTGAKSLLQSAKILGINTLLISGGFTFFTERLKKHLGIDFAAANQLQIENGVLTGQIIGPVIDSQAKAEWLKKIYREHCSASQISLAIGDGANDIPMLKAAHLGIAYRSKPLVQKQTNAVLNHHHLNSALNFLFLANPIVL